MLLNTFPLPRTLVQLHSKFALFKDCYGYQCPEGMNEHPYHAGAHPQESGLH